MADEKTNEEVTPNFKAEFDSKAEPVEGVENRGVHTRGKPILRFNGNLFSFFGMDEVGGTAVPVYEKLYQARGGSKIATSLGRFFYLGNSKFVLRTERAKAKNKLDEIMATGRKNKAQRVIDESLEDITEETKRRKAQSEGIEDREDKRFERAYGDKVDENGNKIAGSIKDFAQIAQTAGDEYAEKKAKRQALMQAEQSRQQSIANSRAAGLSNAHAALLANDNVVSNYNNAYNQAENQAKGQYMQSYDTGLNQSQNSRQQATNRYDTANNRRDSYVDRYTDERSYQSDQQAKAIEAERQRVLNLLNMVQQGVMTGSQAIAAFSKFLSMLKSPNLTTAATAPQAIDSSVAERAAGVASAPIT